MVFDPKYMFVLIEWYRYLLRKNGDGGFYIGHRMEDKNGYDFNVDINLPQDYFLSHTVEDFYEKVASHQPLRADWVNRKAEIRALESQLKAFGWILRDPGEPTQTSVIVIVEGKAYTISREPDGTFLIVHEPEPGDATDNTVTLRLPADYMPSHTHITLYNTIARCQKDRTKSNPITSERMALYDACRHMGWPIEWEYTR